MLKMICVIGVMAAGDGAPTPPAPATIAQLAWLQGCWELAAPNRTVEEQWMAPRGRSMLGMSRTVAKGELTGYELVVIKEAGDRLVYEAHPSGQAMATFPSKSVTDSEVTFEDPEHDFPQRIGYRRDGEVLNAWIEGTKDGKTRRIEFPYRRVACPSR